MKLDFFNNLANNLKENNLVPNFMKELSDYLSNDKNNNKLENNIKSIDEISQIYKLSRNSLADLRKERDKILQEYVKETGELYFITYKNPFKNIYTVAKYTGEDEAVKAYLSGAELPNNAQENVIMKKENDKFIIDEEATKIVMNKIIECAKKISDKQKVNIDDYREENCLYQVIDFSPNGVFLRNTNNSKVFEETSLAQELINKIGNDSILRYKDGEYVYEENLTDEFLKQLVNISEYKKIQESFIKESNILKIAPNTRYNIKMREKDYTILNYNVDNTIKVPNALIPYFAKDESILYYENGEFKIDS